MALNRKLLLASVILVVSAMCLEGMLGTDMSLTAVRQGTSDTFDISLSFTAMDENGTAIPGATVYCSDSSGGTYSQVGTTDSNGKYSSSNFLVSTISPAECPKKEVTRYCYVWKGDVKTETVSGTAELSCYVAPTATPTPTPTPTKTPTPTPPVIIPAEKYCEKDGDCACGRHTMTGNCFYGNADYVDTSRQCPDFCTGIAGNLRIVCVNDECKQITTPATPIPTPTASCGDTHAAVVSGASDNTCSAICSSLGKTCMGMSSCDGNCLSDSCSNHCGSAGAVAGCKCA